VILMQLRELQKIAWLCPNPVKTSVTSY
jgi:hypothetical protein